MFADLATGASCLGVLLAYVALTVRYANKRDREIAAEQKNDGAETERDSYMICSRPAPWLVKKASHN